MAKYFPSNNTNFWVMLIMTTTLFLALVPVGVHSEDFETPKCLDDEDLKTCTNVYFADRPKEHVSDIFEVILECLELYCNF